MRLIDEDDLRAIAEKAANRTDEEIKFERRVEAATLITIFTVTIAFLAWCIYTDYRAPINERAAYNEGYYGVDRATAMEMAERGIGKSAEDIIRDGRQ